LSSHFATCGLAARLRGGEQCRGGGGQRFVARTVKTAAGAKAIIVVCMDRRQEGSPADTSNFFRTLQTEAR